MEGFVERLKARPQLRPNPCYLDFVRDQTLNTKTETEIVASESVEAESVASWSNTISDLEARPHVCCLDRDQYFSPRSIGFRNVETLSGSSQVRMIAADQ